MIGATRQGQYLDAGLGSDDPGQLWWGFMTSAPTPEGGGTEVPTSGTNYTRIVMDNNLTKWPAAAGGIKSNAAAFQWLTATAAWGRLTHLVAFDNSSGGNIFLAYSLVTPKTVDTGDAPKIEIGKFTQTVAV